MSPVAVSRWGSAAARDCAARDRRRTFIDIETTGEHPVRNQIIEIAVRRDRGRDKEPAIALDTLVRPEPHQRVGNREFHGITNRDIRKAPTFKSIAGLLLDAISDCVLIAHNAVFDCGRVAHVEGPCRGFDAPESVTARGAGWAVAVRGEL